MSTVAFVMAAAVLAALTAPHLVPLQKTAPPIGIAVWTLVLALRAVATVALATLALVGLADVSFVQAALAWCWHELLPDLPRALGFAEHPISHAAVAVPAAVVAASLVWLAGAAARAALATRRLLQRALGSGPLGSTVIHDERVVFAVTGFGRGRVLVSDRALQELDPGELSAGLTHEYGHLRRRHRPVRTAASLLAAVGRPLPGTRFAERELHFQLERDADRYTVQALHDPLALASAICKAAGVAPSGAVAALGGPGRVTLRLEELLNGGTTGSVRVERAARLLVAVLGCLVVALIATAPAWGFGKLGGLGAAHAHQCQHAG